jgi:2-hydroxy-3-oxopropionate reductase
MERLGFIGLGIMGKPMARNLLKAGYPLAVYNRRPEPMRELAIEGAVLTQSPADLARQCDVIISCVSDSPDVEAIALGQDGIITTAAPRMLYIDMSTIAPATARKVYAALQERGVAALDAPVSGGDIGAQQGTLSIMVGGEVAAFERALPILQVMGKNIVHVGTAGAGQVTKACNQIVVSLTAQAVAEALLLARRSGVDPARVRQALLGGFAQSRVLEVHGQRMLDHSYAPGFKLNLLRKDLAIVLQTAREQQLPLLATAQVTSLLDALLAQGQGHLDTAALALIYDSLLHASPGQPYP